MFFFKTNKASWIEYRLMGFFLYPFYLSSNRVAIGIISYIVCFLSQLEGLLKRTIKEVMLDIELFFVGYYARVCFIG